MEEMREIVKAELNDIVKRHNETCGDMTEETFLRDLENWTLQKMSWASQRGYEDGVDFGERNNQ